MSVQLQTLLNGVTAAGAGPVVDLTAISGYQGGGHTVVVSGINGDTVLIEGTIDGTTWFTINSFTADGSFSFPGAFDSLRGNVSAYSAGTITMKTMHGILDTNVLTRLSNARALLLDNLSRLDANISSVSPANVSASVDNMLKQLRKGTRRV